MVCFELLIASLVQESIDKPCLQKFISLQNSFLLFLIMLIGNKRRKTKIWLFCRLLHAKGTIRLIPVNQVDSTFQKVSQKF